MFTMNKLMTYTEAIREATEQSLARDSSVVVMGLGVSYKNGADGTMGTLKEQYPNRVFDTPVSEFCNTGVGVGAAITGMKPIIHHARVEFGLFAADQIVTQAAKWNYMFGGNNKVPIVFRLAVGRQWGNGPQHTQALYSLFGNVPGLKVVIPSSPYMAKGLLNAAIQDNNPVVYLEPRWLYGLKENIPEEYYCVPLDKARVVRSGSDLTIVTYGDGVVDSLKAHEYLSSKGISVEIVDLVSINPIDYATVASSVKKTKRLLCVDTTNRAFNIGGEIIAKIAMTCFDDLSMAPRNISTPDTPCPTSTSLTEIYYPTKIDIVNEVLSMLGQPAHQETLTFEEIHILPKITVVTT
jgi:pyruvate dehydrogenase E1 component beta subunit